MNRSMEMVCFVCDTTTYHLKGLPQMSTNKRNLGRENISGELEKTYSYHLCIGFGMIQYPDNCYAGQRVLSAYINQLSCNFIMGNSSAPQISTNKSEGARKNMLCSCIAYGLDG